jgi:ABC-type lipoprotein release transport system permease subunit
VAIARKKGHLDWTVVQGRLPRSDGEIAVGTRVANREGVGPGDPIRVDGTEHSKRLRVVGVVLLPAFDTSPVGSDVVVSTSTLAHLSGESSSQEAIARVADGQPAARVSDAYKARYELQEAGPPAEVRNLGELGALPVLLGAFLGCIGAVALVQALVLVVRRRADDLAVLRALGFSTRQLAGTVAVVGLATVAIGIVIGIPAGLAVGRLAWWIAANSAGVATDTSVPILALAIITMAVPVVALLAAAVPSRRAASLRAGPLLRAE